MRSVWSCPLSWLCVCPGKNSPGANPAGQRKRPVATAFVRRKGSRPQLTPSPSGLSPAGDHKQHHHPEHDFHQDLAEVWAVGRQQSQHSVRSGILLRAAAHEGKCLPAHDTVGEAAPLSNSRLLETCRRQKVHRQQMPFPWKPEKLHWPGDSLGIHWPTYFLGLTPHTPPLPGVNPATPDHRVQKQGKKQKC